MRILVTGSRDWKSEYRVYDALDFYAGSDPVVVQGECPTGADLMARKWCSASKVECVPFPADWQQFGRKAGPIRNKAMVDAGADLCLAFIGACTSPRCSIEGKHNSHGATGCADLAEAAGIETVRFYE